MDKELPTPNFEPLDRRGILIWCAICALAGVVVVLGAIGYEVLAELLAATLCLGVGLVTLTRKEVFDRFFSTAVNYRAMRPEDPKYRERMEKLEVVRRWQRTIVPPFAILVGLVLLAGAIESLVGFR